MKYIFPFLVKRNKDFIMMLMKNYFILVAISLSFNINAQIRNLVLEGGGVRGIAYVGAIQSLEEHELLESVQNISGTSVGAITATLLCVGYSSEELKNELSQLKIQKFNDGRGIFIGGFHRMNQRYGWYRGEKLTKWVDELISAKTGCKDLTFGQLKALSDSSSIYKNLYVSVTNLSSQNAMVISHHNFPNMRVADGVRISASIPFYYSAVFMDHEGKIYQKPPKHINVDVMADGGFLSNYPIHTFDDHFSTGSTIGLRLDEEEQIKEDTSSRSGLVPYEISNFRQYIGAFYNLVIEELNRNDLTQADWERTISISTCGVGPKVKKLSPLEISTLIEAGYASTDLYLRNKVDK